MFVMIDVGSTGISHIWALANYHDDFGIEIPYSALWVARQFPDFASRNERRIRKHAVTEYRSEVRSINSQLARTYLN